MCHFQETRDLNAKVSLFINIHVPPLFDFPKCITFHCICQVYISSYNTSSNFPFDLNRALSQNTFHAIHIIINLRVVANVLVKTPTVASKSLMPQTIVVPAMILALHRCSQTFNHKHIHLPPSSASITQNNCFHRELDSSAQ